MKKLFIIVIVLLLFCSACNDNHIEDYNYYLAGREVYITAEFRNKGEYSDNVFDDFYSAELNRHLDMSPEDSLKLYNLYNSLLEENADTITKGIYKSYEYLVAEWASLLSKGEIEEIFNKYGLEYNDRNRVYKEYAKALTAQQILSNEYYLSADKSYLLDDYPDPMVFPEEAAAEEAQFWSGYAEFEQEMMEKLS